MSGPQQIELSPNVSLPQYGLEIQGADGDDCHALEQFLSYLNGGIRLWAGDYLNYLQNRWGEQTMLQAHGNLSYAYGERPLMEYMKTARAVPIWMRRSYPLSYTHYRIAARYCPTLDMRERALRRAFEEGLSTEEFYRELRRGGAAQSSR